MSLRIFLNFNKVLRRLAWFCKQYNHLCLQTYAVFRSSWNWKKNFFYAGGNPIVNHFTNVRVWEILGHTVSSPNSSSKNSSTKGSITSVKPTTWKNAHFLRRNATFELKTKYCLFAQTRATRSSNLIVKGTQFFEQLFDKLRFHVCCTYAVRTSAYHQEEELHFRQWK